MAGYGWSYGAVGLPAGIAIDPVSGVLGGTLAAGSAAAGPYLTIVTATDGVLSASQSFLWGVTPPVALAFVPDQASLEGQAVLLHLSGASVDGAPLTYSSTGLPPGLSLDPATGVVRGLVAAGAAANGPYQTTFTVSDGSHASSQTITWGVAASLRIDAQTVLTAVPDGQGGSLSRYTTTDANNGITLRDYDNAGNLVRLTDPDGNATTFVYNSDNQLIQRTDSLGDSTYFSYDANGKLASQVDRDGRRIDYATTTRAV